MEWRMGPEKEDRGWGKRLEKILGVLHPANQPAHISLAEERGVEGWRELFNITDTVLETCMGKEQRCVWGGGGGTLQYQGQTLLEPPVHVQEKWGWVGGGGGTLQHHGQTLCWKPPCTCMGRLWGRCPWGVVRACTWRSWAAGWSVWAPGEQQTVPVAPWASQTRLASGPSWRPWLQMSPRKQDQMIKPLS